MTQSGDEAVAKADSRATATRDVNIDTAPSLPIPADTANVRLGPELDDACLPLLPLIGIWRGEGRFGNEPGERAPQFGQQITFAHDGRALVRYDSVTWLLGPDGEVTGPGPREIGWLRPVASAVKAAAGGAANTENAGSTAGIAPAGDAASSRAADEPGAGPAAAPLALRFTVAHNDGGVDAFAGTAPALTRWEFTGARGSRLYGITPDGQLAYVDERIVPGGESAEPEPYASAVLDRIAG